MQQTELNSGNFVNYWGPMLTPYAKAICDSYGYIQPLFMTIPTGLTNTVREEVVFVTDPQECDILIVAGHTSIGNVDNGDSGQQVFLNLNDLRSGVLWSTPGPIDASPATAFGGSQGNAMPNLLLPEAFFLPAGVRLRHSFKVFSSLATGGSFTWLAIQLYRPKGGKRPEYVTMPDGNIIRIGQRMPWLSTIGLGTEISVLGSPNYVLGAGEFYSQYLPPMDFDVEIHDIHANWFTQGGNYRNPENVMVGIADKGEAQFWMPSRAPAVSVYGDFSLAYPALPFTKPYRLRKGNRLQLTHLNTNNAAINNAFVTVRGVRLGEY